MTTGRIDIHSHLLPGVDDGCDSLADSLECARRLVAAGYTHGVCTPHVWSNFPHNDVATIPVRVAALQAALDEGGVPLALVPGGENNFTQLRDMAPAAGAVVTYAMAGRHVLADIWVDALPDYFFDQVARLQARGLTVVLAHPERMRAVQLDPSLADDFAAMNLLLQGNLQCLGDPPGTATRRVAERFLLDGRYTFLGTDLHNARTLGIRLAGLENAIALVGDQAVDELTITNPRRLLEGII